MNWEPDGGGVSRRKEHNRTRLCHSPKALHRNLPSAWDASLCNRVPQSLKMHGWGPCAWARQCPQEGPTGQVRHFPRGAPAPLPRMGTMDPPFPFLLRTNTQGYDMHQ